MAYTSRRVPDEIKVNPFELKRSGNGQGIILRKIVDDMDFMGGLHFPYNRFDRFSDILLFIINGYQKSELLIQILNASYLHLFLNPGDNLIQGFV
jgi:hypothetical protein